MRTRLVVAATIIGLGVQLVGVSAMAQAAGSGSVSGHKLKLKGLDYGRARKMVEADGWKAAPGPCLQVDQNTCNHFPEIDACASAPDYCGMVFVRQNQCLYITTLGDPPSGSNAGAARIKDATYRPGPCKKY
jgi:hypothetical protein